MALYVDLVLLLGEKSLGKNIGNKRAKPHYHKQRAFIEYDENRQIVSRARAHTYTRVVPKVMSNFFLHWNGEQQTKESAVVDGTSCCVILECLVTSIACIT